MSLVRRSIAEQTSLTSRSGVAVVPWRSVLAALPIVLTGCAVFAVPFVLFSRLILYHFYVRGGFLVDAGVLASVMWHTTPSLMLPPVVGAVSFYSHHVAPVMTLLSAASTAVPVSMVRWFAGFTGVSHGLLAVPVFWLLVSGHGMRAGRDLALAAAIACAFAFNGLALAIARFPHFETFGAACLLLSFAALALRHWKIAAVSFAFALVTREDIGLHAFGFLSVWIVLNLWRGIDAPSIRTLAVFAIAGLAYSAFALLWQHWMFPSESSFARIYLGQPAFSGLTAGIIGYRLAGWVWLHTAIILPAIAIVVWACRARAPLIAAGLLACLPWALLHLLAATKLAGLMVGYYGFPFLIALAWPLIATTAEAPRLSSTRRRPALILAGLIALSLLPVGGDWNPGEVPLPAAFLNPPSAEQERQTDAAIAAIASARAELGRLVVVESVAALAPFLFAHEEILGWHKAPPDTLVYFADGFDNARLAASIAGLSSLEIPGTALRVATRRSDLILGHLPISQ